ncbi:GumC family protein [Derxia gummosa]|uniref:GumC family protein n=1 Tax=Derxia gummosa DSM 723 TaxID=1121388 RepID=A0A8B6X4J4_9BURK|nr:hypothetical protein [Derxia gummosa]
MSAYLPDVISIDTDTRRQLTLREFLVIAFRDRRKILTGFFLTLTLGVSASFLPKPSYTADTSLLLRLGREYVYRPETGDVSNAAPIAYDREQTLRSEVEILMSRDNFQAVLDKLGVELLYPKIAAGSGTDDEKKTAALIALRDAVTGQLLKDTNTITVAAKHNDPEVAARIANELVQAYIDRRREIFGRGYGAEEQRNADQLRAKLDDIEARLEKFKRENGIVSFNEQQAMLLKQYQDATDRVDASDLAVAQSGSRLKALDGSFGGVKGDVVLYSETARSDAVENARKTLLDLRLKERDLSSRYVESHPFVADVRADIARTEAFIAETEKSPPKSERVGRSPVRDSVEGDLLRTRADYEAASASRAKAAAIAREAERQLKTLSQREREMVELQREHKLTEDAYNIARRRLDEARTLDTLDKERQTNVSVVQPARPPLEAKKLQPIIIAVGFVLAVAVALAIACFAELFNDSFALPEQVERRLRLPVLAAIPERR